MLRSSIVFSNLLTNDTIAEDCSLSTIMDFTRAIETEKERLKKLNVHNPTKHELFIRSLLRPKPEDVTRILHKIVPRPRLDAGERMVKYYVFFLKLYFQRFLQCITSLQHALKKDEIYL